MEARERKDYDVRREELLSKSLEVFAAYGYKGASIRKLAAAAGVTEGLFYHYFSGKQELFEAALSRVFERRDQLIEQLSGEISDPEVALRLFGKAVFLFFREGDAGKVARIVLRESPNLPRVAGMTIPEHLHAGLKRLAAVFESHRQQGLMRPDLDADFLVRQAAGSFVGVFILQEIIGLSGVAPFDLSAYADQAVGIFFQGARNRGAKGSEP